MNKTLSTKSKHRSEDRSSATAKFLFTDACAVTYSFPLAPILHPENHCVFAPVRVDKRFCLKVFRSNFSASTCLYIRGLVLFFLLGVGLIRTSLQGYGFWPVAANVEKIYLSSWFNCEKTVPCLSMNCNLNSYISDSQYIH